MIDSGPDLLAQAKDAAAPAAQLMLTSSAQAGLQVEAPASIASVTWLSPSREVERQVQEALKAYKNPHPPDAETGKMISGILQQLEKRIPGANPDPARTLYAARETQVYIVDDPAPNMWGTAYMSEDKKHVVGLLVISESMLENIRALPGKSLEGTLGVFSAHETSHALFAMNPWLTKADRFQPRSQEYLDEIGRLHFPSEEKRQQYIGELQADKLGLWLWGDTGDANHMQVIVGNVDGQLAQHERSPNESSKTTDSSIETSASPHPSINVRLAENRVTAADIQKVEHENNLQQTLPMLKKNARGPSGL